MKNRKILKALIALCIVSTHSLTAQISVLDWVNQIGSLEDDNGSHVAVDVLGNVYTVGEFGGTVNFDMGGGTSNLTAVGGSDIFIQKSDADGNFIWVRQMGGTANDKCESIVVDASGNVYTTGNFASIADFDPGAGVVNLNTAGGTDIFVQKLDANGDLVWVKRIGGTGNDNGSSIALDPIGNILITGRFEATPDFDPGSGTVNLTSAGSADSFILKLDAEGDFVWVRKIGGTGFDGAFAIMTDEVGDIYSTGIFSASVDLNPGSGSANFTSAGLADIYIQKLNSDGDFFWARRMGGSGQDFGACLTVDGSGNVYTTGIFVGTVDFNPGSGTQNLSSAGGDDIFVQKLNTMGNLVWAKRMGGSQADGGLSIALDSDNNVYTTGRFGGTVDFDPGLGTSSHSSAGSADIFIQQLNEDGNYIWSRRMGGSLFDQGLSVASDASGNVYATGYIQGTADFDPQTDDLISAGGQDVFIQKLSQCFPTAPSPDVLFLSELTGQCSVLEPSAPTASNGCGTTFIGTTNTIFPVITLGTTLVTWAYDDGNGNIITQTQDVVVTIDVVAPVADLASLPDVTEQCSVDIVLPPTSTDNCVGMVAGTTSTNFPIIEQGTTTIVWTFDDGNGNLATQNQIVTVTDSADPVANNTSLPDVFQCSEATVTAPTATDNCAGVLSGTTTTIFPITTPGNTVVTWTYDDGNGNIATQDQNIIIGDVIDPTPDVTSLPDVSECIEAFISAPTASDNCAGALTGATATSFPITEPGTTVILWTYDDGNGNVISQIQNVIIGDNLNPVPDVANLSELSAICEITASDAPAPTATDNCAGSITATTDIIFPITDLAITQLVWAYDDGNGNVLNQIQSLEWNPIDISTNVSDHVITANNATGTYQWLDCDNDNAPILGEIGQSFTAVVNGNYAVEISEDGCVDVSSCVLITTVGLASARFDVKLVAYPNPSSGVFTIEFDKPIDDARLTITDMQGRVVSSEQTINTDRAIVNLTEAQGFYLLTITNEKGQKTIRLIKQQ